MRMDLVTLECARDKFYSNRQTVDNRSRKLESSIVKTFKLILVDGAEEKFLICQPNVENITSEVRYGIMNLLTVVGYFMCNLSVISGSRKIICTSNKKRIPLITVP
jgi:hypothetical protein